MKNTSAAIIILISFLTCMLHAKPPEASSFGESLKFDNGLTITPVDYKDNHGEKKYDWVNFKIENNSERTLEHLKLSVILVSSSGEEKVGSLLAVSPTNKAAAYSFATYSFPVEVGTPNNFTASKIKISLGLRRYE